MPANIRTLQAEDFERGFLETLACLSPVNLTSSEATVIWQRRKSSGVHTVVAEIDGKVVGTASLILEKKYIHRGGLVGHLEDVVVHRDHGGRGIGKELVEHLIDLAGSLRCYKVILNCTDKLVPYYSQCG